MLYSEWDKLLWDSYHKKDMEDNNSFMTENFNMPIKFKNEGVITMGKRLQHKLMNKYDNLCIVDGSNGDRTVRRLAKPVSYKVCNNGRVVIVKFSDDTTEKAVLSKDDAIMYGNKSKNELIKTGFEICVMKKILSVMFGGHTYKDMTGTKIFNSIIRFADKAVDRIDKEEVEKKNREQAIKNKKRKEQERKKRRAERRREEEFNRQVEIQKEAIIRANAEMNNK